jgi:hypothetical protein
MKGFQYMDVLRRQTMSSLVDAYISAMLLIVLSCLFEQLTCETFGLENVEVGLPAGEGGFFLFFHLLRHFVV